MKSTGGMLADMLRRTTRSHSASHASLNGGLSTRGLGLTPTARGADVCLRKVSSPNPMSKSKSDRAAEMAGRAIGAVLVFYFLKICALPFYLLYVRFTSHRRAREIRKSHQGRRAFWLKEHEKARYRVLNQVVSNALRRRDDAIRTADENGITKSKDGSYSVRSKLGKEVRSTLDEAQAIIQEGGDEIRSLRVKPQMEWGELNEALQSKKAAGIGIFAFAAILPFSIGRVEDVIFDPSPEFAFIAGWFVASALGGILFFIAKWAISGPAAKDYDMPPTVDLTNLNTWDDSNGSAEGDANRQPIAEEVTMSGKPG